MFTVVVCDAVAASPARPVGRRGAGRAELQQLDVTVVGDEDVRRFQVAVDEAAAMNGAQRVGQLRRDVEQPIVGQRTVPR